MGMIIQGEGFVAATGGGGGIDLSPDYFWSCGDNSGVIMEDSGPHGNDMVYASGTAIDYHIAGAGSGDNYAFSIPAAGSGTRFTAPDTLLPATNGLTIAGFVSPIARSPYYHKWCSMDGPDAAPRGWQAAINYYTHHGCLTLVVNTVSDGVALPTSGGSVLIPDPDGGANQWTHVAYVMGEYDSGTNHTPIKFYINGVDAGGDTYFVGRYVGNAETGQPCHLGRTSYDESMFGDQVIDYRGGIDEVGLWTRPLSGAEIAALADQS